MSLGSGKLGKHGLGGCVPGGIRIHGISSHHGLGMHAEARVEYVLDKKFHQFRTSVALNDSTGNGAIRPVEFRILGDGKVLWRSYAFHHPGGGEPCLLDITGVNVLRLEVQFLANTSGKEEMAHAAWIDPYVSEDVPSPAELALYQPERFAVEQRSLLALRDARELFDAEKFDELEATATKWRKQDEFGGADPIESSLYERLCTPSELRDRDWQTHFDRLERWQAAKPDSITALIVYGKSYYRYGWQARGQGYASTVAKEAWSKFEERIEKARGYLEKADAIGGDPEVYAALIHVGRSEGAASEDIMRLVEKGRKLSPRYWPLYGAAAIYFLPQWTGDPQGVQKFADRIRQELGGELGDEVYFRAATEQVPHLVTAFFSESGFKYDDLLPGMRIVLRDYPEDRRLFSIACYLACISNNDDQQARTLLKRMDPTTFTTSPWHDYAAMEYLREQINHFSDSNGSAGMFYPDSWMGNIAYLGTTNRLITSGADPRLTIFNLTRTSEEARIPVRPNVGGMAVDSEGQTAIVRWMSEPPKENQDAAVYKLGSTDPPLLLMGHTADVVGVAISRDGKRCATTALDNTARIWNLAEVDKPITLNHPHGAHAVAFAPDGKILATTDGQGMILLWNAETGDRAAEPLGEGEKDRENCLPRFFPDDKEIIWAAPDGTIRRWNLAQRKYEEAQFGGDTISQIGLSPDGKWLAVGREGGALELVDAAALKIVHTWYGHFQAVTGIAFSPDGKTLVSSSLDGGLILWPIEKFIAQ